MLPIYFKQLVPFAPNIDDHCVMTSRFSSLLPDDKASLSSQWNRPTTQKIPLTLKCFTKMTTNTVIKVSHKTEIYLTDLATKITIAITTTLPHQVLYTYLRETATQSLITEALSSRSLLRSCCLWGHSQPNGTTSPPIHCYASQWNTSHFNTVLPAACLCSVCLSYFPTKTSLTRISLMPSTYITHRTLSPNTKWTV